MATETATATNPTDAQASSEASATLISTPAAAGSETDGKQQTPTTQTQQPEAAAAAADGSQKADGKPAAAAPEKYEFKAPEGMEYDPAILDSFSGAAREANLTQEAAQKLIDKMAPAIAARQADQVQAIHKEWQEASTADKEFGGEKLAENLGVARKALDAFGTPDLRKLLEETGLGNHPEVIRFLFKTGKAISEDKFVGGRGRGGDKDVLSVLYNSAK